MFYFRIYISDNFSSCYCQRRFIVLKNSDPLNQLEEDMFLLASNPREASSSRFIIDETRNIACLMHLLCSVSYKYFEIFVISFYISQYHLAVSSEGIILPCNVYSLIIKICIFTDKTVATNCINGMFTYLFGVTLHFPIKRR